MKKYRVQLKNKRIVGPFVIKQIVELYKKGHINGDEKFQIFPVGDWAKLNSYPEILKEIEKIATNQEKTTVIEEDSDSTVIRLSLAKEMEELRKQKQEEEKRKKIEKLEELEKSHQESAHQVFRFDKEDKSQIIDYEELEKKFKEKEITEILEPEEEVEEENQDLDKTQVNPDAIAWLKEQERKKVEEEIRQKEEEQRKKIEEEKAKEEEVDFEESTQMFDKNMLVPIKNEAILLEKEFKRQEEEEIEKEKEETTAETEEIIEDETPKKKRISPIMALVFIGLLFYLLEEDKPKEAFKPQFLVATTPITYEIEDPNKAFETFKTGVELYSTGSYLNKLKSSELFKQSIEFKFKDNPALGWYILTMGELFNNVVNKPKAASIVFNLVKITRSKVYKDTNIAIGTALFYKNNGKIKSALNLIENFIRVGKPNISLFTLYMDLAIESGDLVLAKKIKTKIEAYPNLPPDGYLSISNFFKLDEKYTEGENSILEGLKKYPSSCPLLLAYSDFLFRKKDIKGFYKTLLKVEALKFEGSPEYYAGYLERIGIYSALQGDPKKAALFFKMALKLNDTNELRSKLASLEVGGGKVAEKLILESKAIDLIRKSKKFVKERKWEEAFFTSIQATDLNINYLPADLNLASLQIQRGFYESAINTLRFLRKEFPLNPHVSFLLVKALYSANKMDEAQLEIGEISNSKLRQHHLYESVVGHYYEKAKRYSLAIKFLNQSVANNPLRDQDYYLMAKIYSYSRQYKESKSKLSEAITLDPLNIDYKSLYAEILFELEGSDTAIGYLQTELDKTPDHPRLLGDMATFYYRNGQLKQFKEVKEKVEKLITDDLAFYEFLIEASKIEENEEAVVKYAEELLNINPGDVETRMLLGQSYAKLGQYNKALDVLKGVTDRLSTYPGAYYLIAKVYLEMKNYNNALEAAKKEKENNPKIYNGYFILGETYRLLAKYPEAVKNLEQAISLDPRNVESLMSLGWIKLNQMNYEIARELYLRAKKQSNSNPEIRKQLGFIYQGVGQSALAIEEFETYLKLYPNAPDRTQIQNQIKVLSR